MLEIFHFFCIEESRSKRKPPQIIPRKAARLQLKIMVIKIKIERIENCIFHDEEYIFSIERKNGRRRKTQKILYCPIVPNGRPSTTQKFQST